MDYLIIACIAAFLAVTILLNVFIFAFQERLIFQGRNISLSHRYDFDLDFEEIFLEPEPESRLHILHFKVANPEGVILYFHGNRADLRRWGKVASRLTKYNYDVFVMDYRGYGKSVGHRTENIIYKDASLLYQYVADHFSFKRMVLFGRSLGSAVAVELATKRTTDLLILETPISQINNALYRYRWLLNPRVINRLKFDSINKVQSIKTPTLILHGTRDIVVPIRFARDLMRELATKEKKIIQINKGGHNNLNNFELYHDSLKEALSITNL